MADAIAKARPKAVAFVHAETSTGVLQPVEPIARATKQAGALLILDCVTSLGGIPVTLDAWGVDAAYSGTQKCLSCPPGLSPVSFSPRAVETVLARKTKVQSWYLDVSMLARYYGGERVYHHTAPVSMIYAIAEALRVVEEEGMSTREARHRAAAAALIDQLAPLGFTPLVAPEVRLPSLTTLRLPERIIAAGEAKIRRRLLDEHDIEVGGGLGKLAGSVWRIGLMGENARIDRVERLVRGLLTSIA
jgi:alanine-glyoxylate transaminase/serine-glyoxylate transaminase/serine-pyruvate transaminase